MQKSQMNIHLQLAEIFKRFELGSWGWAHFLRLFKLFADFTNFFEITLLRMAQMIALNSQNAFLHFSPMVSSFLLGKSFLFRKWDILMCPHVSTVKKSVRFTIHSTRL
jgi:hypothetical protein